MIYGQFEMMFWFITTFMAYFFQNIQMNRRSDKIMSYEEVKGRLMRWCSLQDRAQMDALNKMHKYGLTEKQCEALIRELKEMKFLDDHRFAESFVTGHVRLKKWGKYKLLAGLKQHGIVDRDFQPALDAIDLDEYRSNLQDVIQKKLRLKPSSSKEQLMRFALQRGYEHDLVMQVLDLT